MSNFDESIFTAFKNNKLAETLFLNELRKYIGTDETKSRIAFEFGTNTNNSSTETFLISIMPTSAGTKDKSIRHIIFLDAEALKQLSLDGFNALIDCINNALNESNAMYYYAMRDVDDIEIPRSEYIKLYACINKKLMVNAINSLDSTDHSYISVALNIDKFDKVLDKCSGYESYTSVMETVNLTNCFAKEMVNCINDTLGIADQTQIDLIMDQYFKRMISVTTSRTNPYWHKVIDPNTTDDNVVKFIYDSEKDN